jgi:hypothetical protein
MVKGVSEIFPFSGEKLLSIDAVSTIPDETIVGKYQSKQNTSGKLYINVVPTGETTSTTYECAPDVSMMFDETPATINSFSSGDYIEIELSDGVVTSISGTKKESTISNATVTDVTITPSLKLTISHADEEYDGMSFDVSDNVIVKKNNQTSSMDQIYAGDKVSLTLEYGVITKITATSTTVTREGVIRSITFSDRPSITVLVSGEEQTYEVTRDCTITVNDSTGELYDFRVGDKVTLTLESDAVTKIKATSSATTSGSITGVVTSVNSSYGFINVELNDGTGMIQTVFCRDSTTKFLNATTGDTKNMSSIKTGDTVQVNGTVSNGAFVAKVVLITPAS